MAGRGSGAPRWGWFATVLFGLLILAIFVAAQFAATFVLALRGESGLSELETMRRLALAEHDAGILALSTLVSAAVGTLAILLAVRLRRGARLGDSLALVRVAHGEWPTWLMLAAGFLLLSDALTLFLGRSVVPEFMRATYAGADPVWPLWLAVVVAAPVFEEAFFRGFLHTGLEGSAIGVPGAVFVTALLWAGIHLQYDLYGIATIFVAGLFFGAARHLSGSLAVPLLLHAMFNTVAMTQAALLR